MNIHELLRLSALRTSSHVTKASAVYSILRMQCRESSLQCAENIANIKCT